MLVEAVYNPNMPFKWNAQRIQTLPQLANQTVGWGVVFALYTSTTTLQHLSVFYCGIEYEFKIMHICILVVRCTSYFQTTWMVLNLHTILI